MATILYLPSIKRNTIVHLLPQFAICPILRKINNEIATLALVQSRLQYHQCAVQYNTTRARDFLRILADGYIGHLPPEESSLLLAKIAEITSFVMEVLTTCGVTHIMDAPGRFTLVTPIDQGLLAGINLIIMNKYGTRLFAYDLVAQRHPHDDIVALTSVGVTSC